MNKYKLYKQYIPVNMNDPEWAQRRVFVRKVDEYDNSGSFEDLDLAKKEKFISDDESGRIHIIMKNSDIVYSGSVITHYKFTENEVKESKNKIKKDKDDYKDLIKDLQEEIRLQREKIKTTDKQLKEIDKIIKQLEKDIKKAKGRELKKLINEKESMEKKYELLTEQLAKQETRLEKLLLKRSSLKDKK